MMTKIKIATSALGMAESNYNSAFGVIAKIERTASRAANAAQREANKAETKRLKAESQRNEMNAKKEFYQTRAAKIAKFIADLG